MDKLIPTVINSILKYSGSLDLSIIVILLIACIIFYVWYGRLMKELSVGACKGNPNKCVFNSFAVSRKILNTKINRIKSQVKQAFMMDFSKENYDKHYVNSEGISRIVIKHSDLVDACFVNFHKSIEEMLLNNHIPNPYDELTARDFDDYIEDTFDTIWRVFWEHYKNSYSQKDFYLELSDRITLAEQSKNAWFEEYKTFFKKVYKIKEEKH